MWDYEKLLLVVYLTRRAHTAALEFHALDALEVDHVTQVHPGALQPTIWQESRRAAVDFLAFWLLAAPILVLSACPGSVSDHHESVFAIVGDDWLVGQCGVMGLAVVWGLGKAALNWNTSWQFWWSPSSVTLAVTRVLAHKFEAGHTFVLDLQTETTLKDLCFWQD